MIRLRNILTVRLAGHVTSWSRLNALSDGRLQRNRTFPMRFVETSPSATRYVSDVTWPGSQQRIDGWQSLRRWMKQLDEEHDILLMMTLLRYL
jgi:hypothetical protein